MEMEIEIEIEIEIEMEIEMEMEMEIEIEMEMEMEIINPKRIDVFIMYVDFYELQKQFDLYEILFCKIPMINSKKKFRLYRPTFFYFI